MAKRQRSSHLTGEQQQFIVRLIAEFAGPTEIQQEFEKAYGFTLALTTICHYSSHAKWREPIAQMRAALINRLDEIPLCSKFYRLKKLDELFHSENRYRTVRYSGRLDHPIEEKPVGELRQIAALVAQELGELRQVHEHAGATDQPLVFRAYLATGEPVPAPAAIRVPASSDPGSED